MIQGPAKTTRTPVTWRGHCPPGLTATIGCAIGYAFGAKAEGAARRLVGADGIARANQIMDRHGNWAIVVCRPIPVLAESSVVFAGLVGSPVRPFIWMTTLSNLGIALAYAAVGAFSMEMQSFLLTFAAALALPGIAMLAGRRWLTRGSQISN